MDLGGKEHLHLSEDRSFSSSLAKGTQFWEFTGILRDELGCVITEKIQKLSIFHAS